MARELLKSLTNRLIETIKILDNISDKQNIERTLHDIIQSLHDILRCQTCAIIQLNPKTEKLEILNSIGLSWQFTKKFRTSPVLPELRDLIWLGEPVLIRNAESDERLADIVLPHLLEVLTILYITTHHEGEKFRVSQN